MQVKVVVEVGATGDGGEGGGEGRGGVAQKQRKLRSWKAF